jgi:diphthamide biosynthesis protein 2
MRIALDHTHAERHLKSEILFAALKTIVSVLLKEITVLDLFVSLLQIDAFVLIACPENSLLDSKEFYRPIVTPYEVELACNANREWSQEYILEFHHLLPGWYILQF